MRKFARRAALATTMTAAVLVAPAGAAGATYVKDVYSHSFQRPSSFQFSVNGDLVGRKLSWSAWGSSTTSARGRFTFSPRPAGSGGTTLAGRLTLSRVVRCGGRRYYSKAVLRLDHPERAPFKPFLTIRPC